MPPTVVLTAIGLALLSGPSAFLFLWLTYKRTGEVSLRTIAFSMIGLVFLLIGNGTEYMLVNVLRQWDLRVEFLILNEAFLATVATEGFLLRFAHQSTRTEITVRMRATFWAFSILFFFLVLSLPMFLRQNGVDIPHGYLASTIYGTLCTAYATFIVVRNRKKVPPFLAFLPGFFSILMAISVLAVSNDLFHFGELLGGPAFPFSPVFLFLINVSIVVACARELLRVKDGRRAAFRALDFEFSQRESEIVPLIIEGLSNDDIASRLFISPHTVKNHVTGIFRKAGVTNRFELLRRVSAGKAS
jgi:DNA-binding CsgD family transcriptional regulator